MWYLLSFIVLFSIVAVSVKLNILRRRDKEGGTPPGGAKRTLTVISQFLFGILSVMLACFILVFLCIAMLKYMMSRPTVQKDIPYESFVKNTDNRFAALPRSRDFNSTMIADSDPVWFCYDVLDKGVFDKFMAENALDMSSAPSNSGSLDFLEEYIRTHNFDIKIPNPSDKEWNYRHGYAGGYGVWMFWKDIDANRVQTTLIVVAF